VRLLAAVGALALVAAGEQLQDVIVPESSDIVLAEVDLEAGASVSNLQKQFDALQAKLKAGAKITPQVKSTIDTMISLVKGEIEPAIKEAKATDQQLINLEAKKNEDLNTQAAGQIQVFEATAKTIRSNIAAHNRLAEKWAGVGAKHVKQVSSYEGAVLRKTKRCCEKRNAAVPDVEYTPPYAECDYDKSTAEQCLSTAASQLDAAIKSKFESGEKEYRELDKDCTRQGNLVKMERTALDKQIRQCDTAAADCKAKEDDVSKALPGFNTDWSNAHLKYKGLFRLNTLSYRTEKEKIEKQERHRNNEWDSTQKIKCMLVHYAAGTGKFDQKSLNQCNQKIDHSFLKINYPAEPPAQSWNKPKFATLTVTTESEKKCHLKEKADEKADEPDRCTIVPAKKPPHCTDSGAKGSTSDWILIAAQAYPELFPKSTKNNFELNAKDPSSPSFMNIKNKLGGGKCKRDGMYDFKLDWGLINGKSKTVRWVQSSNPTETTSISDFKLTEGEVNVTHGCNGFKGLAKSTSGSCVVDGNGANGCWWNCVGAVGQHNGGIPGPSGKIADTMKLYVKC